MSDEPHITITKITIGAATGAGGTAAKAVAEGFQMPTSGAIIGYMTIALLGLQIFFLISDRIKKHRRER